MSVLQAFFIKASSAIRLAGTRLMSSRQRPSRLKGRRRAARAPISMQQYARTRARAITRTCRVGMRHRCLARLKARVRAARPRRDVGPAAG